MKSHFGLSAFSTALLLALATPAMAAEPANPAASKVVVDDQTITSAIQSALQGDQTLAGAQIQVETTSGVVRMWGSATQTAKAKAIDLAWRVQGVKEVREAIQIQN